MILQFYCNGFNNGKPNINPFYYNKNDRFIKGNYNYNNYNYNNYNYNNWNYNNYNYNYNYNQLLYNNNY